MLLHPGLAILYIRLAKGEIRYAETAIVSGGFSFSISIEQKCSMVDVHVDHFRF